MDIKDLTEEQIARAKECRTAEERLRFLEELDITLPDEQLEKIGGGIVTEENERCFNCITGFMIPTGNKRPGEIFGDWWPDYEYRCSYCGRTVWK